LQDVASKMGLSSGDVASALSERLPGLVDQLTPNGQLPSGDILVGGTFRTAGDQPSATFARYRAQGMPPTILTQPLPLVANPSTTVELTGLTVSNEAEASYTWRRNGVSITGQANVYTAGHSLYFYNVTAADEGLYDCVVTNACGSVISEAVPLTVRSMRCSLADIAGAGFTMRSPDGSVDGSDFIAFINSFAIGEAVIDPLADVAGVGADGLSPDGVIDGTDFIAFINAFAVGC
jgi:hypothetical protein